MDFILALSWSLFLMIFYLMFPLKESLDLVPFALRYT